MAQYFIASINSTPAADTEESISMQLAQIERQCRSINKLEPLGRMNYSRVASYEENHWDLVEIARICIQLEEYGKLEEVKDLLLSIKQELSAKDSAIKANFEHSDNMLKKASLVGRYETESKLEKIFSDLKGD